MIRRKLIVTSLALVTALGVACNDSSPSPATSIGGIWTGGGLGGNDGGSGGDGGDVDLAIDYGTGGHIVVSSTGAASASFSPASFMAYLGDNPLVISTDTVIEYTPAAVPALGVAYIDVDDQLYVSDGDATAGNLDADELPVTGISVDSGTTLTFGVPGDALVTLDMYADFSNDGTVTVADQSAAARGSLDLTVGSFLNRGTIDLEATLAGQDGGDFDVDANSASFINHGPILAAGGDADGADAGDGGAVTVYGEHFMENTALIDTHGGNVTGATGFGGGGGDIYLESDSYGDVRNSGRIDTRGGEGVIGGGSGGDFDMYIEYTGDCMLTGSVDLSGGDTATGTGGDAGDYACDTWQGGAFIAANITAVGGSASDAAGSGGGGGDLDIDVQEGSSYEPTPGDYSPNKDLELSGNFDLRGGDAQAAGTGSGGSGGDVTIGIEGDNMPLGQEMRIMGISTVDTQGGNGNSPGDGGDFDAFQEYAYDESNYYSPGGFVFRGVDIDTRGGNVVATATTLPAFGGSGGDVEFDSTTYHYSNATVYAFQPQIVSFQGNIDTSGGESLEANSSSADAGDVWMYAKEGVSVQGSITARGGDDAGATTGYGGDGGEVDLLADFGDVSISGTIDMRGGDGAFQGGDGGAWDTGTLATSQGAASAGAIMADGGDADPLVAGSAGGDGGEIWLFAPDGGQGVSHGALSAGGGAGETAGFDGEIIAGGYLLEP